LAAQIDIIYSSDCMMRDTSYTSERIFNFPPPPPGIRTKQAGDGGRQGIIANLAQIRSLASNLMECIERMHLPLLTILAKCCT